MAKRRRKRSNLGAVTKQDFVGIANVLCENGARAAVVTGIANYVASKNPRFARERFVGAAKCRR